MSKKDVFTGVATEVREVHAFPLQPSFKVHGILSDVPNDTNVVWLIGNSNDGLLAPLTLHFSPWLLSTLSYFLNYLLLRSLNSVSEEVSAANPSSFVFSS